VTLAGHSHDNNPRDRNILVDSMCLQKIFLTVEVDRKITGMSGQEYTITVFVLKT